MVNISDGKDYCEITEQEWESLLLRAKAPFLLEKRTIEQIEERNSLFYVKAYQRG